MIIKVDESPVGVGKTYNAIEKALTFGGLWLFAVERIDSIKELASRFEAMAKTMNIVVKIVQISSEPDEQDILRGSSVRTEVESLASKYQNGHVIAICSHSAMLMSDFSNFTQWHFVCDEVPALLDIEKKQTKLDLAFFEKYFELETLATGKQPWSLIKPTAEGLKLTGADFVQDQSHKHLAKLHLVATLAHQDKISKYPVSNLSELKDMENDKTYWVWWSVLYIDHFKPFQSITFLASRFMKSMTRKIIDDFNKNVKWKVVSQSSDRRFANRNVSIRYYTERQATKSFLESKVGHEHLKLIAADIAAKTKTDKLIWSSNESLKKVLANKLSINAYRTPKQAGTDKLMSKTQAAMIYSSYPANYVLDILKIFDLDKDDWLQTNEYETILQFVSRTSVRDANSTEDAQIFVYNKTQAQYLFDFFSAQKHNSVDIEYEDLNLEYPTIKSGRPKIVLSAKEAKLKADKARKKKTDKQRENRKKKREMKKLIDEKLANE